MTLVWVYFGSRIQSIITETSRQGSYELEAASHIISTIRRQGDEHLCSLSSLESQPKEWLDPQRAIFLNLINLIKMYLLCSQRPISQWTQGLNLKIGKQSQFFKEVKLS